MAYYAFVICILFCPCLVHAAGFDDAPIMLTHSDERKHDDIVIDKNTYILGPDDVVNITVYNEPELSKSYTIDGRGMIAINLIGEIKAAGLSTTALAEGVRSALADGYFVNPSVSVDMASYKPVYIMGEVRAPGQYAFKPGMSILSAAAIAGGFTYRANRKEAEILRSHADSAQSSYQEVPIEAKLMSGDIILIKERFF